MVQTPNREDNVGKVIGIDLGTTNSVVAVIEGSEQVVIPNSSGDRTTPSVVAFREDGERLVGRPAKNQAISNPTNTIGSIKRFIGCMRSEVDEETRMVSYEVCGRPDDQVRVRIGDKEFAPPEISAMILAHLKKCAEEFLGEEVTEAVITVPAYFNDSQRQATKQAGEIAGFEVRRIINEPTAAALAYSSDKKEGEKILVFDLGGGTFDVSILEVSEGVVQVISTSGDTHLGGDDYDQALIDMIATKFEADHGIDLREDKLALQRLKEVCEMAKRELSQSMSTKINLPFITAGNAGPLHLDEEVTRAKFENITSGLTDRCREPVMRALEDANFEPGDLDEIVMVGGSTRMPSVQDLVREIFGKEPNKSVNPDEVVAIGAAIQGSVLSGGCTDLLLLDVTPLTLGIETHLGVMEPVIPRNTTIPITSSKEFTTVEDNQDSVDLKVFQGEFKMTDKNRQIGMFTLTEIPPARAQTPRIEVTFDIDANGILHVTAKDKATGNERKVTIDDSSSLSDEDVERMKVEAAQYADEDDRRAELVELQNLADRLIGKTEELCASREELADPLIALKVAREGDDEEALKRAMDVVGQMIYAQPPAAASEEDEDVDFTVSG